MTAGPNVLFLAVGGTRRRGVVEASAQVVAAGGRATVVIGDHWHGDTFDPEVRVIALSPLELRRTPMRIEQGVLYALPALALRAIGRGRLAAWAARVQRGYARRVADRVHRRLTLPAYRRLSGDVRHDLLRRQLATGPVIDIVVVADGLSLPLAQRLLRVGTGAPPTVTFDVAYPTLVSRV